MTDANDSATSIQPAPLAGELFGEAKWWWRVELVLLFSSVLVSLLDSIFQKAPAVSAGVVALLTLGAWAINLYWKRWNDLAQRLSRLTDFHAAFGWAVPTSDMADIRSVAPRRVKARAQKRPVDVDFFASKTAPGEVRAIENLRESAFWSKALATRMAWFVGGAAVVVLIISVSILFIALRVAKSDGQRDSAAITAMAVLTAGVSVGLWSMFAEFMQYVAACKDTVTAANHALDLGSPSQRDAIILWGDYHIARGAAPLIPNWLFSRMHDELDADYRQTYHASGGPTGGVGGA